MGRQSMKLHEINGRELKGREMKGESCTDTQTCRHTNLQTHKHTPSQTRGWRMWPKDHENMLLPPRGSVKLQLFHVHEVRCVMGVYYLHHSTDSLNTCRGCSLIAERQMIPKLLIILSVFPEPRIPQLQLRDAGSAPPRRPPGRQSVHHHTFTTASDSCTARPSSSTKGRGSERVPM